METITNYSNLDWDEILEKIAFFASSDTAKDNIREIHPLANEEQAQEHFELIKNASTILDEKPGGKPERPSMESLDFFSPWALRLKREALLKKNEIKDVRWFCEEALALKELILVNTDEISTDEISISEINRDRKNRTNKNNDGSSGDNHNNNNNKLIKDIKENVFEASGPLSMINSILTTSGDIRTDASEKLYQLINEKRNLSRDISNTLDQLVKAHEMENLLQDKYVTTREGRWVLPIKGGMQHQLDGVIHASSNSKQTVFMEPHNIIPLNNRIRQIEQEIEEEVERLLKQLSDYLSSLGDDWERTFNQMKQSDILFSLAQFTDIIEGHPCKFSSEQINLQSVRHPLLVFEIKSKNLKFQNQQFQNQKNKNQVVSNCVNLDQKNHRILLLTGPNAGGKTVLLKSIGLAAHMARCGIPPCTQEEGSSLPFFKDIVVSVGDAQSVDEHLSTFAAHLKVLNQSLKYKGAQSLLLVDEICGSTDPEEGSALARSFINSYSQNHSYAVITSHLGALKTGWDQASKVINGSLDYDLQQSMPTYQFLIGVAGESLAIQTAKRVGVNEEIIKNALSFLTPETRKRLEQNDDLEQSKQEFLKLQQSLLEEKKEMQKVKNNYENLLQKLSKEKEQFVKSHVQKAEKQIDQMITQAKADAKAAKVFHRHETLENLKQSLPQVVTPYSSNQEQRSQSNISSPEEFARRYPPGSSIFVSSLKQDGIVQGRPNQKGLVPVMVQSLRLHLHWEELEKHQRNKSSFGRQNRGHNRGYNHRQNQTTGFSFNKDGGGGIGGGSISSDGTQTVDLRGLNVEQALETLEIQLDQATIDESHRLKIIHGHGTNALKKAVRTYLSRSLYVEKWTANPEKDGSTDSGITWAYLQ